MNYKNAKDIFPPELLREIQNYVQGERIYIPQLENMRVNWGNKSGSRQEITFRNSEILKKYKDGYSFEELSELFCLSSESIRKIVYKNLKDENKYIEGERNVKEI
ncbi:CD3324 family protein [Desnuesiella massiliensis]|uniref:CD3324 family protein n=1 Tax=Desnuesiella massiliensis TaxID=1650662 RepID=UPI0006E3ECCE|nr:CD3324 family protein [Desnuesiella massiliensis]